MLADKIIFALGLVVGEAPLFSLSLTRERERVRVVLRFQATEPALNIAGAECLTFGDSFPRRLAAGPSLEHFGLEQPQHDGFLHVEAVFGLVQHD